MTMRPELKGLVLAGGKSSRMKEPKAWLNIKGLTQWQRCDEVLAPVSTEVLFSVSPQLLKPLLVPPHRLVEDVFKEPCGPVGGIISAFHRYPAAAFFVLACDMPNFDERAVEFLVRHRDPASMATIFVNQDSESEPLCGIYEPAIVPSLLNFWSKKVFCPRKILENLDVKHVVAEDFSWLKNVNHPSDLEGAAKKKITLNFYAGLREMTQCSSLEIFTAARNIAELFQEISGRHEFLVDQKSMRFAKNHALVDAKSSIHEGDTIVFIPPVSGG